MSFITRVFRKENSQVVFLGCEHTSDSKKIYEIEKILEDFNPEVILIEGGFEKASYTSKAEAIKDGEMGYISFWANSHDIKILPNDPTFKKNILFLEKEYNKDFSFLYFFLRDKTFDKQTSDLEVIERIKKESNWKDYDFTMDHINLISKNIFKKDLTNLDYTDFFNPTLNLSSLNKATRQLNIFRDDFMIHAILKTIKIYRKVFIIKGKHHLIASEKKIEEALNNGKKQFYSRKS